MLAGLRKGADSIFIKILMGFLLLSFVVWGIGDIFRGNTSQNVATVEDSKIHYQQYVSALNNAISQFQQVYGQPITVDQLKAMGEHRRILDQMINDALVAQRMHDLDVAVGDNVVASIITNIPYFRNESGVFDPKLFQQVLKSNGINEENYVASVRNREEMNLFLDSFTKQPVVPDFISKQMFKYENEIRYADIIMLPKALVKEAPNPTDADLLQYYSNHTNQFSVPEMRRVKYVVFDKTAVTAATKPTEAELKDYYDNNQVEFQVPGKRELVSYVFDDEAAAKEAHKRLLKGEVIEGKIEMGEVTQDELPKEIQEIIFALPENEFSEPTQTALGWHIFQVTKSTKDQMASFDDVKIKLAKQLAESKQSEALYQFVNELEDQLASGLTLDELAKEYKLKIKETGAITNKGIDEHGKMVTTLPDAQVFLPLIFSQDIGIESSATALSDNETYVIARVEEIMPTRIKALDEVKGLVAKLWKKQQHDKKLKDLAENLAKDIKAGKTTLGDLDQEAYTIYKHKKIVRYHNQPLNPSEKIAYPEILVGDLFSLKEPGDVGQVVDVKDKGYAFAILRDIKTPDAIKHKDQLASVKKQYGELFVEGIVAQYVQFLKQTYDVEINEALVEMNTSQNVDPNL